MYILKESIKSPDDIDYGKQLNFVLKPLSVGMQNKDQITLGSFPAFVKQIRFWLQSKMKITQCL